MKFKSKINLKIAAPLVLLMVIPALFIGIYNYQVAQKQYIEITEERLQEEAADWQLLISTYEKEIVSQEKTAKQTAKDIVTAQAKVTYELIQKALDENNGVLSFNEKEDIFNRLNRHTVGKSGYVWILDYEGHYVLSKGRQRDGENIWEVKDSDGNMVIQDLVGKGKEVSGTKIAYHSYPWINKGEPEPREKIAAMIHFSELEWVVGVSTYYDDLVDMDIRKNTIEKAKTLMAQQVIGKSGYIWVVDSNGVYQVSKNRLRDGENINDAEDANGVLFIQEAVKKAKANPSGGEQQVYPWQNKGETSPRMKVAGLSYVPEWDWVIGVSAYYDDFEPDVLGPKGISIILLITVLMGIIIIFATSKIKDK